MGTVFAEMGGEAAPETQQPVESAGVDDPRHPILSISCASASSRAFTWLIPNSGYDKV